MKNWQLRWFVLRPEALYFYKDQDEAKAQVKYTMLIHYQPARVLGSRYNVSGMVLLYCWALLRSSFS